MYHAVHQVIEANSNHKRISKRSPFLVVLMMSSLLARPIFFFSIFFSEFVRSVAMPL